MPLHDYECLKCKKQFEVFYSTMSAVDREEPEEKCPECQSVEKKRLISKGTTHIFKSGSWAKSGY